MGSGFVSMEGAGKCFWSDDQKSEARSPKSGKTALTRPIRCGHHARVRKLFPGPQNTLRQGAGWPKFPGCVLALILLATSAIANPQLDPTNPTSFFTNVAMAMFRQMGLHDFNGNLVTITNIPIYEDPTRFGGTNISYYTPAVHQILQLAANIFDATTNRFINGGPTNYPTVFRPIFSSQNGIATIIGYEEVTNPADAFLPMLNASDFVQVAQPVNSSINMYGVPWVIGAKKGFPNFNQFSMENSLTVQRILQFTNSIPQPPWQTNQVYNLAISNTFGLEAWNSYTNFYGRPLQLVASNELSITITNETGLPLLEVNNLPFGADVNFTGWPGWTEQLSDDSFQIPLYVSQVYTNGIIYNNGVIIPIVQPLWSVTVEPHLWMILQFKLRYVLIDTSAQRIVDFVNLIGTKPPLDITVQLAAFADAGGSNERVDNPGSTQAHIWETNFLGGTLIGVFNQMQVDTGLVKPPGAGNNQSSINGFISNLGGISGQTHFEDWYHPTATIYQGLSWQANDPLVHYTTPDLTSSSALTARFNNVGISPAMSPLSYYLTNLNFAYQPWGGYHLPGALPQYPNPAGFDLNYQVKDPGVQQSDDWNFPTGESLAFEWLGRVHRGTPWQTVFLKPSNQTVAQWSAWNNDNILVTNGNLIFADATFTHPNNDWRIASLWAQWVNTNDLSTLLSINNTDTNAWAARLDGLTALTNSAIGELDPITITSNSPQAGIIAQAIQTARANANPANGAVFPNNSFQQVGDVLATPQLSVASPFININALNSLAANGITDEALEIIPTQLLPVLRVDSFGQIAPTDGQLQLSFSGYDGHTYAIQASSNLTDWVIISTNCPSDGNFGITNTATSGQQFYRSVLLY